MGIDVGTQSLRAGVFDRTGTPVTGASHPLTTTYRHPGWAEQRPAEWWDALAVVVGRCLADGDIAPDAIVGLSVDGSCSNAPVDADGVPLGPAILWMDLRAHTEADRITATRHPALRQAGGEESSEWPLPKALWLKAHEPHVFERAAYLLESTNWLIFRLTGELTLPLNSAVCKWHYRAGEGWPRDLFAAIDMADMPGKLPSRVLRLGEAAGRLTAAAARALGLRPGTVVGQGGIDAYTGMLGVDVLAPGKLALVMGSSTCQLALMREPTAVPGLWGPFPEAVTRGTAAIEGGQASTGSVVRWLIDNFGGGERRRAAESGTGLYDWLDARAGAIPAGAEGLVVLDHWQGSRTPIRDPLARGQIAGLTLGHGFAHLLRAVYEGTAYGNRQIVERLRDHGVAVGQIVACGGGVQSRLWLQLHADVAQLPIALTAVPDAVALGTAICGAVAAGVYDSPEAACARMVRVTEVIEPDPSRRDTYDFYYDKYLRTYRQLAEITHEMATREVLPN
jgi:FGGY-family pentulose kinase